MSLDNTNKINHYISQTIYESELLAEKDAKKEIKLSIESNNTDEMKMVIAEYSQINNPYKLLNSEFELKVKDPYNFLNDTDRLNFIADEIADNFNYQFLMVDTGKDARRLYNQIDNIQDVVYSTKKLKIKSEAFQKYLKTKIKPQENTVEGKSIKEEIISMFFSEEDAVEHLKLLKDVSPPVIDEDGHYRLGDRNKSVFVAWVDVLAYMGYIKDVSRKEKSKVINKLIPGANIGIDGRLFDNHSSGNGSDKYHNYYIKFSAMLDPNQPSKKD